MDLTQMGCESLDTAEYSTPSIEALQLEVKKLKSQNKHCEHDIGALKRENNRLRRDLRFLDCLRATGVDRWCGYHKALNMLNE